MTDLFRQHTAEWLRLQNCPDADPLLTAIAIGKAQILADVRAGRLPQSVSSFSELHDHVDANYYGNAFDWPVLPSETEDSTYQWAFTDFWNAVQDALSSWIASGQMRREIAGKGRGV